MRFKEGDTVIYSGHEAMIMKVLENSNRYRVKNDWNGKTGSMVGEQFIYKTLKEYNVAQLEYGKMRLEQLKIKFEKDKLFWEERISKSELTLSEQGEKCVECKQFIGTNTMCSDCARFREKDEFALSEKTEVGA